MRFSSIVGAEASNCILCGLCVSRCKEATYHGVIGFFGRGVNKKIANYPEKAQACKTCNYCYSVCPTGQNIPWEQSTPHSRPLTSCSQVENEVKTPNNKEIAHRSLKDIQGSRYKRDSIPKFITHV